MNSGSQVATHPSPNFEASAFYTLDPTCGMLTLLKNRLAS